jgi:hypothetical protein
MIIQPLQLFPQAPQVEAQFDRDLKKQKMTKRKDTRKNRPDDSPEGVIKFDEYIVCYQ